MYTHNELQNPQATSASKGAKGSYTAEMLDEFQAKDATMWPCIVFEKGDYSLQTYLHRRYVDCIVQT